MLIANNENPKRAKGFFVYRNDAGQVCMSAELETGGLPLVAVMGVDEAETLRRRLTAAIDATRPPRKRFWKRAKV